MLQFQNVLYTWTIPTYFIMYIILCLVNMIINIIFTITMTSLYHTSYMEEHLYECGLMILINTKVLL